MSAPNDKLHLTHFLLVVIILGIGFIIGRMTFSSATVTDKKGDRFRGQDYASREINDRKWHYISPLLDCTDVSSVSNKKVNDIKSTVRNYIDSSSANGVTDASVYFRDLSIGPWFEIESDKKFYPASLLKVPLMMSVLKQSMDDPAFLSRTLIFKGPSRNNEYFRAPQELQDGSVYTVEDAMKSMILYSDNNASHLLSMSVDESKLLESYQYLGIDTPSQSDYTLDVRTYASFFRILYNSTFLNREYSEKALQLLSQTAFNNGLVAGVPVGTVVSHKFGERQLDNGKKQLHDCGIVYAPGRPYLLCVMTRGSNFEKLDDVIAEISKIVYDGVVAKDE